MLFGNMELCDSYNIIIKDEYIAKKCKLWKKQDNMKNGK